VAGSKIKDRFFTRVPTCLIALVGMQELLLYGIMVCYCAATEKWLAFVLSGGGLLMLVSGNIGFYLFYKRRIASDPAYEKWTRLHPRSERYIAYLGVLVNFKCFKLLYSGFYG
jgi:hypothetical protein